LASAPLVLALGHDDLGVVYRYTVVEQDTGQGGVSFDPTTYYVSIEARLDPADTTLYVVTTVRTDPDGAPVLVHDSRQSGTPHVTFTNTYQAELAWDLAVSKTLVGRAMTAGEFSFEARPADQASADGLDLPLAGVRWSNATARPDGAAESMRLPGGARLFTQADAGQTYCLTVREVVPNAPPAGLAYDQVAHRVCASIADNRDGSLTLTTTVVGSDGTSASVVTSDTQPTGPVISFTNRFGATVGSGGQAVATVAVWALVLAGLGGLGLVAQWRRRLAR
jgi:hypothetical protein